MAHAPIISIFLASGGPAVARGVLIAGTAGKSGLFLPWPGSLSKDMEFSVYVPESDDIAEEWLTPAEVGILGLESGMPEFSDQQSPDLGVVSFTSEPARDGTEAKIGESTFLSIANDPERSLWAALEAARADDLTKLRELSVPAREHTPPPGTAGTPERQFATTVTVGSFICRFLLRWD